MAVSADVDFGVRQLVSEADATAAGASGGGSYAVDRRRAANPPDSLRQREGGASAAASGNGHLPGRSHPSGAAKLRAAPGAMCLRQFWLKCQAPPQLRLHLIDVAVAPALPGTFSYFDDAGLAARSAQQPQVGFEHESSKSVVLITNFMQYHHCSC